MVTGKDCPRGYPSDAPVWAFEYMSLDHDLGACAACMEGLTPEQWLQRADFKSMPNCDHFGTGYTFVCWMEKNDFWPLNKPLVHSRNPVGAARMRQAIDRRFK